MRVMFLMPAVFAAITVVIVVACAIEEEPSFIAGGWCDTPGVTACDDTFMTILYCNDAYLWEPLKDCPEGCTEESGLATCIGGGSPDNAVPDTSDSQLPDTVDEATGDDATVTDETPLPDDTIGTDDGTVTNDDGETTDDIAPTDEDIVTDDTGTTDDATVTDDATATDDATVADEDTVTDDTTASDDDAPAGCSGDWTLNDTTGTCYRYFADTKSFEAAENACVAETGHLVSIASAEENNWVRDDLGIPSDTAYWIGYTAKDATGPGTGSANGTSCSSAYVVNSAGGTYTLNTAGASSFSSGCTCSGTVSGNFVSFRLNYPETGYWEIMADTSADAVITIHENPGCDDCVADRVACVDGISTAGKEVFNDQYQLNSSKWYVIMIAGKSSDVTGTLYIRPPITTTNFADHYVWTDGSSDLYDNFATGQPDYANSNERCAQVSAATVWGEWADTQCATTMPYVCEKNP